MPPETHAWPCSLSGSNGEHAFSGQLFEGTWWCEPDADAPTMPLRLSLDTRQTVFDVLRAP
jgi:hypothetical protein